MDYKSSGVDIKKADRLVAWIKKSGIKQIGAGQSAGKKNSGKASALPAGSDYASLFPFPAKRYKDPVLAASADGVGTKLKLAAYFSDWRGIGQDLAAMCLNDLLCVGAKPLFFLDYYACGALNLVQAKSFLKGLQKACAEANCPLVGGETAELPGLYKGSDMDCAGFAAGVVEREKILGPQKVKKGDEIIALPSSGFHSNGYSLLRQIYKTPEDLQSRRGVLMRPTRLYTFLTPFLDQLRGLRAMAHITGGGLDNLSRIIPSGLKADLQPWKIPPVFLEAKERGGLSWATLLKTFNCGLGLILIVRDRKEFLRAGAVPQREVLYLGQVVSERNISGRAVFDQKAKTVEKRLSPAKDSPVKDSPAKNSPANSRKKKQLKKTKSAKQVQRRRGAKGALGGVGWAVNREALQRKSYV